MLTRRSLLKRGGYAVLATAVPSLMRTARAQTTNFDYYIGPSGSDSNPGTQGSPWSITALNTKRSVYAGKNVGLLPGTYNCYALVQAGSFNQPALVVNGGPSASNPTLIAAVSPRTAILTGANPSGGGYPSNECAIIGQGQYGALPPNPGNVIIDGLYITRGFQMGIAFYFAGAGIGAGVTEGGPTGIEIRNCEIYDIGGNDNDNVAGIFFQGATGAWVHNNKIHSIQPATNGQNPDDVACIYSYNSYSNIYEYNTLYDCNNAMFEKASSNGNHTFRYNYVECAGVTPQNVLHGGTGGNPGDVNKIYNNILKCPSANLWDGSLGSSQSTESLLFYNNTCIWASGQTGIFFPNGAGGSNIKQYNNVFSCGGSIGYEGVLRAVSGTVALSDFNLYPPSATSQAYLTLWQAPGYSSQQSSYTLSQGQAAGYDAHSAAGNPSFNSTGTLAATGYQLIAGSLGSASGSNPGRVGGSASGALCDMGAWGGANPPTQIGCNFGPVPMPPVIISVT
jgi:hypothetical protein